MKSWKFWMQPRNSKSAPVEEVIVQAENIEEATSKAISKKPGHIWLQHEELGDTPTWIQQEMQEAPKVFVVVHKSVTEDPTPLRTTTVAAVSPQAAFDKVVKDFPDHQILQVERAEEQIYFDGEPAADWHGAAVIVDDAPGPVKMPTEYGNVAITDDEPKPLPVGRWRPQVSEDEPLTLETIVAQAVGAGSTCWSEPSNGIFDDVEARRVVDGAVKAIMEIGSAYMLRFKPTNPETAESLGTLIDDVLNGKTQVTEGMTRAMNFGYELAMKDAAAKVAAEMQKLDEGPVDGAPDPQLAEKDMEILRLKDKLFLLAWLVEHQAPFGTELANFKRRLALLIGA